MYGHNEILMLFDALIFNRDLNSLGRSQKWLPNWATCRRQSIVSVESGITICLKGPYYISLNAREGTWFLYDCASHQVRNGSNTHFPDISIRSDVLASTFSWPYPTRFILVLCIEGKSMWQKNQLAMTWAVATCQLLQIWRVNLDNLFLSEV
jgi:hypothetical protein